MIKLEIININNPEDNEIPRLELWMVEPRKMLVEASAVKQYMTSEEFKKAWRELTERKAQIEFDNNQTPEAPVLPSLYKQKLKEDVDRIMQHINDIFKDEAKPRSRVIK